MSRTIITLTTDFGIADTYVAQMKGVILGIAPEAAIVDSSHAIPAGDIRTGGLAIDQAVEAFPERTIHIVVVDPGVGSDRALVGVEAGGWRFLAPDNGVLSDVLCRFPATRAHRLAERRFWRQPVSATFHGRDILAPVAALWSLGADMSQFGPAVDPANLLRLAGAAPQHEGTGWQGEVVSVDRFGNLITNLPSALFRDQDRSRVVVMVGDVEVRGLRGYYSEVANGTLMALVGSSGRLEIAVSGGSAAEKLGLGVGAMVRASV